MKISPSWFLQDSKSHCTCRNIKPSLCFYFLIVMRLQLSKMEFSDMKITWQKVSCVQICMGCSDPRVCAMPCRGAGICPAITDSLRATGRAEKPRQMLLKLYGTYLREAKQRTNAFLLECIKVGWASCTESPSPPTGFTAMHGYNCMHPFLALSLGAHCPRSGISHHLKKLYSSVFSCICLGCLRIHCLEDVSWFGDKFRRKTLIPECFL